MGSTNKAYMCFAPYVSFSVAAIEFALAAIIWAWFRKSRVTPYVITLLFLLGAYQFTEFMLCTTGNSELWVRAGFIAYSFLPVVGVHFVVTMLNFKSHKWAWLLYIFPAVFSAVALFGKGFVEEGTCNAIFVTAKTWFYTPEKNPLPTFIYGLYYYIFIAVSIVLVILNFSKTKSRAKRIYYLLGMVGLSLITISPYVFILLLPSYGVRLPSIFCEFALVFAIFAFIASYLDHKHKIF
jgi:hypothetical protein